MKQDNTEKEIEIVKDEEARGEGLKYILSYFWKTMHLQLPTPLAKRFAGFWIISAAIMSAGILATILLKDLRMLSVVFIAFYFAYQAYNVKQDYRSGKISDAVLICSSVTGKLTSSMANIVFQTADDVPAYYTFRVPKKKMDDFVPNVTYILYFNIVRPTILLGYEQI